LKKYIDDAEQPALYTDFPFGLCILCETGDNIEDKDLLCNVEMEEVGAEIFNWFWNSTTRKDVSREVA
jgi:hypothetical protein